MRMGVWITYKGRETKFFYACERKDIKALVFGHFDAWRNDENGPILVTDATAVYVTKWSADGERVEASEPIDIAACLR